jgi:GT2 family glycosyltransferase
MTRMSVVVLSYDRPVLLQKALASIAAQTHPDLDVIVIDNRSPSSDAIRELVPARFPGVKLTANAENRGFTGGMNQGIAQAAGEYVYLTEDDIELAPDCIERLAEYLDAHPDTGLAGPVMWNRHQPTIRCAGGRFELGGVFSMSIIGAGDSAPSGQEPYRTLFLPGAMIAARTAFLGALGGFHPDFFMYREDLELCCRVLRSGRPIVVVPSARVFHHEPAAAEDPPTLAFHKHKNLPALYLLHARWSVLPEFLVRYAVGEGMRRLVRDRRSLGPWFRAWCWVASHAGRLLAERRLRPAGPASGAPQSARAGDAA